MLFCTVNCAMSHCPHNEHLIPIIVSVTATRLVPLEFIRRWLAKKQYHIRLILHNGKQFQRSNKVDRNVETSLIGVLTAKFVRSGFSQFTFAHNKKVFFNNEKFVPKFHIHKITYWTSKKKAGKVGPYSDVRIQFSGKLCPYMKQ